LLKAMILGFAVTPSGEAGGTDEVFFVSWLSRVSPSLLGASSCSTSSSPLTKQPTHAATKRQTRKKK
jgi:hypothetical protein